MNGPAAGRSRGGPAASPAPAPDPAEALAEACARYADLILLQLDALGAEDFSAFDRCAEERDAVADRIEGLQPSLPDDVPPDAAALVAELFARCGEADQLLLQRLTGLHADAATALASHDERRPHVLAYGSAAPPAPCSLDVLL